MAGAAALEPSSAALAGVLAEAGSKVKQVELELTL